MFRLWVHESEPHVFLDAEGEVGGLREEGGDGSGCVGAPLLLSEERTNGDEEGALLSDEAEEEG
jgi:hypothetical protein